MLLHQHGVNFRLLGAVRRAVRLLTVGMRLWLIFAHTEQ